MLQDLKRDRLAALGALAIGAATGRLLLDSMNTIDPVVAGALSENGDPVSGPAEGRGGRGGEAESRPERLVLVVIDGLGEEVFEQVTRDTALSAFDWRATVDVGSPSLSRPVYHVLLTGVPQAVSGIQNNAHSGRARADDLAARVREDGGAVGWALETVPWFFDLFGQPEDRLVRVGEEPRLHGVTDRFDGPPRPAKDRFDAMASVLADRPRLAVLHFTGADHAGHHHGANSLEYRAAAEEAIRTVLALRDASLPAGPGGAPREGGEHGISVPARPGGAPREAGEQGISTGGAVWMIGADHGHLARGGHGGPEPEVRRTTWIGLWPGRNPAGGSGKSVSPVVIPGVVSADRLAATFAAILRVPPPIHALGEPLPLPDRPSPAGPAWEKRREAAREALDGSTRKAHFGVLARAGVVAAALVAWIAAALRGGQKRDKALAIAGAAISVLGACVGFWLLGPGLSLSAIRTHFAFMSQSLGAIAIGAAIGAPLLVRWRTRPAWVFAASAALPAAAYAITAGSMGGSRLPDGLLLLFPATGLVPWGVILGTGAAKGVLRMLSRGQ